MSTHPTQIWSHLSPECRQQITDELLSIFQEVIHACVHEQQDHIRTDHSPPPPKEGSNLRPAIHPHPGDLNQESLRLQYALEQRAQSLGWRPEDIEVIDADLGLTGASAQHRTGFQELVTKVTLGQVGIILSSDVTRLARNCSDWYPLLDVCGYRGSLIADHDGIYDPGSTNGRLLLGLKRPAS